MENARLIIQTVTDGIPSKGEEELERFLLRHEIEPHIHPAIEVVY